MLVHICCSVDSHYFLQCLQKLYPNEKLVGFFYDPNIHPYSEYRLRFLDVKRSCKKLNIRLIVGEYDYLGWIEAVRGLENEPEKGKRCMVCFDNRLEATAKMAKKLNEKTITTTLLTSPKKSLQSLQNTALKVQNEYNVEVLTPDFRKNGGTQKQFELAKKDMLYHQNYCGCLYGLIPQRQAQKRLVDELMSPLSKQILPQSIEQRIKLYEKVQNCEKKQKSFFLKRQKFLNYRLLSGFVKDEKSVLASYILFYSFMKRKIAKGKIEKVVENVGYFSKEEIIFIDLPTYNIISKQKYKSVKQLMFNAPKLKKDLHVRKVLQGDILSLSPIIVLESLPTCKLEIVLNSYIYEDVREVLAIKR